MKLLIDTNFILDIILERQPFYSNSVKVLSLAKKEDVEEYISASAVTDVSYLLYRQLKDKGRAKELLRELFEIVSVAGVTDLEIQKAMELEWKDFEGSVQYAVALLQEMNGIVTRNPSGYGESEILVWLPEKVLELIK